MDVVDSATRSRMISGIRGKNTKPELIVRRYLHRNGLRFRLHAKLPGKPDLAFRMYNTVIFVHGCFWHRHINCNYAASPKSNTEFWQKKFAENVRRDALALDMLEKDGWRVLVVWECQTSEKELDALAATIREKRALERK